MENQRRQQRQGRFLDDYRPCLEFSQVKVKQCTGIHVRVEMMTIVGLLLLLLLSNNNNSISNGFVLVGQQRHHLPLEYGQQRQHHYFRLQHLYDVINHDKEPLPSLNYTGRMVANLSDGDEPYRCGFVCIVGAPNMGKSTLLNSLLDNIDNQRQHQQQQQLAIATPRPQTTRHAILGIVTTDTCQVCFTDTPGIIGRPAYKLQEGMMNAVRGALTDADVLLLVTDPFTFPNTEQQEEYELFQRAIVRTVKPILVVINKMDLGTQKSIEEAVLRWRDLLPNAAVIVPVCAIRGGEDVGVVAIRSLLVGGPDVPAALRALGRPIPGMFPPTPTDRATITNDEAKLMFLPESPPLYQEDVLTDRSERFFASEIIRSTLFLTLGKELPYCCEVRIDEFKEPTDQPTRMIRIKATIVVERDSQKGIVIGKGGRKIKEIGMDARTKLEDFFQEKVHLDLFVKVEKDWRHDENKLKAYGYLK